MPGVVNRGTEMLYKKSGWKQLNNANNITWQTGMPGEVDEGGGGTVAKLLAHYSIRTIDAGAALLSMHSSVEIASKYDVHEICRAYKMFYR